MVAGDTKSGVAPDGVVGVGETANAPVSREMMSAPTFIAVPPKSEWVLWGLVLDAVDADSRRVSAIVQESYFGPVGHERQGDALFDNARHDFTLIEI